MSLVLSGGPTTIRIVEMLALSLKVVLDKKFDDREVGQRISRRWARLNGMDPGPMTSYSRDEPSFGVRGPVAGTPDRAPALLADGARTLETLLVAAGHRVVRWDSVEILTMSELERRGRNMAFPKLVDAGEFAEMCGVSRSRIHGLAAASRRAREDGRWHRFPPPVVPGYWLRTSAEAFARTRKVTPGPAPRSRRDRFMDQLMAADKARREGRPVPEVDHSLMRMPMVEALLEQGFSAEEARRAAGDAGLLGGGGPAR